MGIKTAVSFDEYVYESAKTCSAALGQSMTEWLNNAARAAARRQNAVAYLAWEAHSRGSGLDDVDGPSGALSLDGAEW